MIPEPAMHVTGFATPFSAASSSTPDGGLALQQRKRADRLAAAPSKDIVPPFHAITAKFLKFSSLLSNENKTRSLSVFLLVCIKQVLG